MQALPALLTAALLAGCGGGGGGGGAPAPVAALPFLRTATDPAAFAFPMPTNFAAEKTRYEGGNEYRPLYNRGDDPPGTPVRIDTHLGMVNAAAAYARGATGVGETVVVVDSGFFHQHRELSGPGKFSIAATFGAPCTPAEIARRTCAGIDHGTATTAVAAGRRDGAAGPNMHGVAFDANIRGVRVRLGGGGRTTLITGPAPLTNAGSEDYESYLFEESTVTPGTYDRTRPRGFVFNLSFGSPHGIDSYTREQVRTGLSEVARVFAQAGTDPADRGILVWSAGNQQGRKYDLAAIGDRQGPFIDAASPTVLTALGVHFPELQGHVLVVISVEENGRMAHFSNYCGTAKAFCLAAPGVGIVGPHVGLTSSVSSDGTVTYETDSYRSWQGTSFSAPIVTGALAVMRQFFKNPDGSYALGNTELVTRLLATADRTDSSAIGGPDYSNSDIYGHGLLDLDAATRPVGSLSTAMHGSAAARPVAGTALETVGTALGAGLADTLGGLQMAVFDELDAPFFTDAGQWVRRSGPVHAPRAPGGEAARTADYRLTPGGADFAFSLRPPAGEGDQDDGDRHATGWRLDQSLLRLRNGWWTSWNYHGGRVLGLYSGAPGPAAEIFGDPAAFAAPYLSLVRGGAGLGFSRQFAAGGRLDWALLRGAPRYLGHTPADWTPGLGLALDYRPAQGGLSLQAGMVREAEGFLGTRPTGALGAADGTTIFVGVNGGWEIGQDWWLLAAGYLGRTRPGIGGNGLLYGVSDLRSSAFSLGLSRRAPWRAGARLGLRVTQPLRLESGTARLRLASGRTRYGEVLYRDHRVELAPRGRELELEAAYRTPVHAGELSFSLTLTRHPGQDRRAGIRPAAWIVFQQAF